MQNCKLAILGMLGVAVWGGALYATQLDRYKPQTEQPENTAVTYQTDQAETRSPDLFVFCEMMMAELGLINTVTDQMIRIPLASLSGWPGSSCQHVWATPDGKTVYITVDATSEVPAMALALNVQIDWENSRADATIIDAIELEPAGTPSTYPIVESGDHPVGSWFPAYTQGHGPSFLSGSPYMYLAQWTDQKIRVIDARTFTLTPRDPVAIEGVTDHSHTVSFNPAGTLGIGMGYFYDLDAIDMYRPNKDTGELTYEGSIPLSDNAGSAAFTHYASWLNNRYALTATMQLYPTAQTETLIGPSVWLLDTVEKSAERIIDPTDDPNEAGVFRSASDLTIANFKLYVAEEDSLGEEFGRDGFISVFDISNVREPRFIKRLSPGNGLPEDFAVAHEITTTPDERFVYAGSYASGYIVKIDTLTDEVVHVYGKTDGLHMPHGGFIVGSNY